MDQAPEYGLIDADNHYYEPEDCFTRYGDDEVQKFVKWVSEGKRKRLLFGTVMQTMVANPTFDPITKPGIMHQRLKELADGGERRNVHGMDSTRFVLERLPSCYRDRDARLQVMDEQHLEQVWMFPTLAVGVEGLNPDNIDMTYKVFHSFNRWLEDDWGWAYRDRIYSAAAIPVLDPQRSVEELDFVLERGARLITLRPGPTNGRSPGEREWDPFWARLQEADVPVAYHIHGGADQYDAAFKLLYQRFGVTDPGYHANLKSALYFGDRSILDTIISLVLGNVFGRFPKLRVATVELGCAWVEYCMHVLDHAGVSITNRYIEAFGETVDERPSEVFKRHVWVSPFPEEDIPRLVEAIGADRVLFGSDWPHAEGTEQPGDYLRYLDAFDADTTRKILRDNAAELVASA
jgi:predicted TIM-barrel fold metal-dependent hydrolase